MVVKNKIVVRRAENSDLEDILRLNFELFKKEHKEYDPNLDMNWTYGLGADIFKKSINNDDYFAMIAQVGGKTIGYLRGSLHQDSWKVGHGAELDSLFVDENYRNNGIGKQLVEAFLGWCKAKKVNYVAVRASARNYSGIAFYKQAGFQDYDVVLENKLSNVEKPMATKKEEKSTKREEFKVSGEKILEKVKELIKEGNVRRIIIINEKGETLMEIPLTFAVVGTAIAPVLAAVGALAALIANCTIVVERK